MQNYEVLSARKSQVEAALSNTTNPEERSQLQSELTTLTDYLNDNQARYDLWKEGDIGRTTLHITVANTDWHNRQLHQSEMKMDKIKCKTFCSRTKNRRKNSSGSSNHSS